ncbi:trypsin-like serine peptidase [Microbacterium sp. CFBP 8794]|uniref:trypsin-like serine peptidase n=1 Tax=Microbacterium sp. CFBP 8794 TaxID=2775269 RepID=UPI00177C2B1A|nr:serine protease [Microbacterium sp. CFBP 8794]MBD8477963.1 trypsin-like peptidase domain-containing protein [Microbacterium sp. CFBP 8794]
MEVQSLTEQLLFITVRITTLTEDGRAGSGTGFLLSEDDPQGGTSLLVVTNKHVVAGAATVRMHFLAAAGDSPELGQERVLVSKSQQFVGHPDPEIDIAMIGVGGALDKLAETGMPAFFRSVSTSMCATSEALRDFEPIEPVTFIGYPNGLYDSTSLLPIVRQGHAATAMDVDYEGKPTFLIDASVFPGSSGSPVFLVPRPSAPDKYGNVTIGGPARPPLLLGVVAAVHQRQVPVLQTNASGGVPFVYDLIDLGVVYKARSIHALASQLISGGVLAP